VLEEAMEDEDREDLSDEQEQGDSTEGQDAEGSGSGEGDDEGDLSTERADASSEEDLGSQDHRETEVEQGSRGSRRFQRLSNEVAELRRQRQEWDRERQELQRRSFQQETEAQRQARFAAMTPEERASYEWSEWQQGIERQVQGLRFQGMMEMDRMRFDAMAVNNPLYARWRDKVEQVVMERAQRGEPFAQREVIMDYLVGKAARLSAGKATGKARAAGQRRVEAARTPSGSSKGDAASTRGRRETSLESRLKGVDI
jgi:hypothetical protein